jgi:hypothetical protein
VDWKPINLRFSHKSSSRKEERLIVGANGGESRRGFPVEPHHAVRLMRVEVETPPRDICSFKLIADGSPIISTSVFSGQHPVFEREDGEPLVVARSLIEVLICTGRPGTDIIGVIKGEMIDEQAALCSCEEQ